ncbi:MAG: bifunctional riboflavin kinase/FAD synthetase [Chloroflexi bacterium]|nr:MAG: bifunctional riboflavin kinase/FAD synthetase [Chloroflexota bacterium]
MRVYRTLDEIQTTGPTVLTIGTFDGLHRGHRALLSQLTAAASRLKAQSAVLAFHPRPKTVLAPHLFTNDYLTTPEERIKLFESCGLDILALVPFSLELAQTPADVFVQTLVERLHPVEFWCGHDFALGKNREGNVTRLAELGRKWGYTVREFAPVYLDGTVISSTQVRQALQAGDVRRAAELLGRYPSVSGVVVGGDGRGRKLGIPTANLAPPPERLLPANGVYATYARLAGEPERLAGVTNVGVRPSFDGDTRTVEIYLFDFDRDIYGQQMTVEFVARLRDEQKFESVDALIAQIQADIQQARQILGA